jgi:hypothetical protein
MEFDVKGGTFSNAGIVLTAEELMRLFDEPAEVAKLYLYIRQRMDFATGISGLVDHFNEAFFFEVLCVAHIQGRHKSKPVTRKQWRHILRRLEQLGLLIPRPDLGPFVFEHPLAIKDTSDQNMRGQRGAKEGPDEGPKKVPKNHVKSDSSDLSGDIRESDEDSMKGQPPYCPLSVNTTTTTTANLKQSRDEQPTADCGGGGGEDEKKKPDAQTEQRHMPLVCAVPQALIYPKRLRQPEQQIAGRMVAGLGDQAQQLLDVLAAAIAAGEIRKTPLDYLQGLIRRCQDGTFDPTPGLPIAEQRRPAQTQRQGPSAREKAAERAMDDRLREYERQMQRPRAP